MFSKGSESPLVKAVSVSVESGRLKERLKLNIEHQGPS